MCLRKLVENTIMQHQDILHWVLYTFAQNFACIRNIHVIPFVLLISSTRKWTTKNKKHRPLLKKQTDKNTGSLVRKKSFNTENTQRMTTKKFKQSWRNYLPFEAREIHSCVSEIFDHNSPTDRAREMFKTTKHAESLFNSI